MRRRLGRCLVGTRKRIKRATLQYKLIMSSLLAEEKNYIYYYHYSSVYIAASCVPAAYLFLHVTLYAPYTRRREEEEEENGVFLFHCDAPISYTERGIPGNATRNRAPSSSLSLSNHFCCMQESIPSSSPLPAQAAEFLFKFNSIEINCTAARNCTVGKQEKKKK